MEIRVLQYFLAIAQEQTISGAAASLRLTQPTLSRQLQDLEDELGKQLVIRGNRKIVLTEEGMLFRKRAEEIIDLVRKTEKEITLSSDVITGDIFIGTGETDAVRVIARVAERLHKEYPQIHYHISSGDAVEIMDRLDKGLIDFGVLLETADFSKYDFFKLPMKDEWGVLIRKDTPLAQKTFVEPQDLWDKPLIISRQTTEGSSVETWMELEREKWDVVATYNLIYNASLMVDEGMGYAICLDKLINTSGDSNLCFRPLYPKLEIGMDIIWKKYQIFSKASEKFWQHLQLYLESEEFG